RVIRDALAASRLTPADIDAIEAHGTGTPLGDPIEAGALAEVFGPDRDTDRPVYLGSSKSNIGHTQAAAGVVGVIKMVLALQHQMLPKTLYADEPSPHIAWEGSGLKLLDEARPWPREAGRVRRAGVSSFGLSGTNAHVVLEEPPVRKSTEAAPDDTPGDGATRSGIAEGGPVPLVVSGRDVGALRAQAGRWAEWLAGCGDAVSLVDVAATAVWGRSQFEHRGWVTASSVGEAVAGLRVLAAGGV
ncbi:ketoacyl-synthetase C-terminal extension domain-containing protein, partial [Streptomyces thermogriseus]|uniref:ketoacyl-synthetase C-terminal extension domain-containing protein n=1 Tax=Streptomyces thermogriseus TaxID=75292 RepID=UPI0031F95907